MGRYWPVIVKQEQDADGHNVQRAIGITLIGLAIVVAFLALAFTAVAKATPPDGPPGQGECQHGNSQQECKPDPQPTHGQDCEEHGNQGGVNEDHCVDDDGTTDDGSTDDGSTDDGTTDDGTSDDGTVDDGVVDDGATDDGTVEPTPEPTPPVITKKPPRLARTGPELYWMASAGLFLLGAGALMRRPR